MSTIFTEGINSHIMFLMQLTYTSIGAVLMSSQRIDDVIFHTKQ